MIPWQVSAEDTLVLWVFQPHCHLVLCIGVAICQWSLLHQTIIVSNVSVFESTILNPTSQNLKP